MYTSKNVRKFQFLSSLYGDIGCKVQLWLFDGEIDSSSLLVILESWMEEKGIKRSDWVVFIWNMKTLINGNAK